MNFIKHVLFFVIITLLVSCDDKKTKETVKAIYQCPMKCEGEKVFLIPGSCAVCKMDLRPITKLPKKVLSDEISDESIFNLNSKWNTEEGKVITLKELKGKTLVMVMIYTTCKAACPRLTGDMRNIEGKIPSEFKEDIQYVFISIDPKNDTPQRLKKFAKQNYIDGEEWTFLQGTESSVREFANVLAVKYKQITPLDFSHSNIISVFNPQGELVHQQEGLGVSNKETVESILETITN